MAFLSLQKRQFLRLPTVDGSVDKTDKFAFSGIVEVLSASGTSAFQRQFLRLPIADGSFDKDDRFALIGLVRSLTSSLTSAQKKQLLRLPVVDASFTTSDKFAFFGLMESVGSAETLVDLFDVTWSLDPTWDAFENPQTNDGNVFIEVGEFVFAGAGNHVAPIPVVLNIGTLIVNAGATTSYSSYAICARSGMRVKRKELVEEWTHLYVRPDSKDVRSEQDDVRVQAERTEGSINPEREDIFITTAVKAEDL